MDDDLAPEEEGFAEEGGFGSAPDIPSDMGGMDMGGTPPMDGEPPRGGGEEDSFGFGGAPPLDAGGDEDSFGMGGAPPLDSGSAMGVGDDAFGTGGMGGMADMGGMGGMGMGMPEPEAERTSFGSGSSPSYGMASGGGMPDFSQPTVGPLAEWRMKHDNKISAKAAAAVASLSAARGAAAAEIEKFYAQRKAVSEKRASANREAEAAYVAERDASMVADSWVREGVGASARQTDPTPDTKPHRTTHVVRRPRWRTGAALGAGD